ncbi:MAG: DMT family transporter [Candidatus Cloacimonadales bacterium]|jgi:drug/metabolite transporter (DMT)-like permease|nr:DMT family transporter [Candidatus Cloacimonadota bacterium]MDD2650404.1 DMT family transporter [Candidatus Cloacimonadota bacterium]MDD3502073.1 DMT family transporter [Candidatus Cloacimonadota bacterium]MDX9977932.1 DMT family transporter [Candidatus Cloacimonadales bacterium]
MKKMNLSLVYVYAVLAMFFWSFSFIWVKQLYEMGFKPITVVLFRLVIACIVLHIISKLFFKSEKIDREDYIRFFLLAFFEPFCYFMGESFGMQYVSASLASIIVALIPLITPIFAWLFIKERVNIYEIIGLIVSFAGVLFLVLNDFRLEGRLIGYILMFIAVLGGTNYAIALRPLVDKYSALTIVKVQTLIGSFLFLPFFLAFEYQHYRALEFQIAPYVNLALLAIFPSSLAFIIMTIMVRNLGVVKANIFTNLIPIMTAVLSYFILKESFSTLKLFAMLVVIMGLFVSQIRINNKIVKEAKI